MKITSGRTPCAALLLGSLLALSTQAFGQSADFCWSETWGRSAGTVPSTCSPDQEKNGALCYPKCQAGYVSDGVAGCIQACPAGASNDGFFCGWASYKATEYPAWDEARCKSSHPTGCWQTVPVIGVWVENCRAGYRHVVGFCEIAELNCTAMGFTGNRIANSCTKKHYFRDTALPNCGTGQEYDAGLCYASCGSNADGVGPICWGKGPPGWVQCGMAWAKDRPTCEVNVTQQVLSVVDAALTTSVLIASGGGSAGFVLSRAGWEGLKSLGLDRVKQLLSTAKTVTPLRDQTASCETVAASTDGTVKFLWQIGQLEHESPNLTQAERDHAVAQIALSTAVYLDPTGISGVVATYTKPLCKDVSAMVTTRGMGGLGYTDAQISPEPAPTGQEATATSGGIAEMMKSPKPLLTSFSRAETLAEAESDAAAARAAGLKAAYDAASGATQTALQSSLSQAEAAKAAAEHELELIAEARKKFEATAQKWMSNSPSTCTPAFAIATPGTSAPTTTVAGPVTWSLTDGAARDVGIGANGAVWVIGTGAVGGGYGIYRRTNNTWVNVPGGAERIAVDPQGNAWVVNNSNNIFRYDGTKWVLVNGTARDIGVGANGHVWVIGVAAEAGGHVIYRTTDQGANWTKIPGSAVRISVDPQGNAWIVNNTNNIFRFNGSTWESKPGSATDVGIGADGAAWVIGADGGIYRWENSNWVKQPGGAAQIAAGPNGAVWIVNQGGQIYQANATAAASTAAKLDAPPSTAALSWGETTYKAYDIAAGAKGTVWYIDISIPNGSDGSIFRVTPAGPQQVAGGAMRIAVDPAGNAWVVNSNGQIFRWSGSAWQLMPGAALDVGIGGNGAVWVIGTDQAPYKWNGSGWIRFPGAGTRISVDPSGNPWIVNASRQIFRHDGANWTLMPGAALDIGIGADGNVYAVGTGPAAEGGYQVYRWDPSAKTWTAESGAAGANVAGGPSGTIYVARLHTTGMTALARIPR